VPRTTLSEQGRTCDLWCCVEAMSAEVHSVHVGLCRQLGKAPALLSCTHPATMITPKQSSMRLLLAPLTNKAQLCKLAMC